MHSSLIKRHQRTDALIQQEKDNFDTTPIERVTLFTTESKLVILQALQQRLFARHQLYQKHPGVTRIE
jgi:hypothetical protein